MNSLEERSLGCPYCGETIEFLLDVTQAGSEYIEDCQVCCKPIVIHLTIDDKGEIYIAVRSEDETF